METSSEKVLFMEESWNKLKTRMGNTSITCLVASFKSLFKCSMIFNISPCISVSTWIIQQNLLYLLSEMAWDISCTTHIHPSFIQEMIIPKQMRSHINFSSNQVMHKSTKINNTPNSSIHIVMQIMPDIFITGYLSPRQITSQMVHLLAGDTRNNQRHI